MTDTSTTRTRTRQLPNNQMSEDQTESQASESSSYEGEDEQNQPKRMKEITKRGGKMSKQEMKRIRNREAAKKSRRLKKQHISQLEEENRELREQNIRLMDELNRLRATKTNGHSMQFEKTAFDQVPSAEQIVNESYNSKNSKKTQDDMRFQRITDDDDKHGFLQKFFLVIAMLAVLLFSGAEIKKNMSEAGLFTLSENHEPEQVKYEQQKNKKDNKKKPKRKDEDTEEEQSKAHRV